jgi:hypothetical protein
MSSYHDLDLYGRDNANGSPIVYYGVDAIKNALNQWINSKRGDYLMSPAEGGALDVFQFKALTADNIFKLRLQLLTALTNQFAPAINIDSIEVTPDYENRMTQIDIIYTIPQEGKTDTLEVFLNSQYNTISFEYQDVDLAGYNLKEFFVIKKPDQSSARLIYDYELNDWKWGKYKLTALTPSDPYFTEILIIANGS